jgi:phosphate transport system substrate-binding protein
MSFVRKITASPHYRLRRAREMKETPRMARIQAVARTVRIGRDRNVSRGAIGIALLSSVSVLAMSPAAGAAQTANTSTTSTTTTTAGVSTSGTMPSSSTPAQSGQQSTSTTTTSVSSSGTGSSVTQRAGLAVPHATPAQISGTGSSFAAPAIESWVNDVHNAPYSLSVNYTSSNSGTGRYEFTNQTVDYAVSDIGYVGNTDTTPPSFPFNFIPITAGGIAFMYNVPGLSHQLQLSSLSACGLLTGGIKSWNDPHIAADNPGVSLPNTPVVPVTESDSAGTNYVLEEWCIHEQPSEWAAFVAAQESQSGGPTDGVAISATSPNSNWPGIQGGLDAQSTTQVASDVATNAGAIGAVQVKYASDSGFGGSDPSKNVALVKNASGDYTPPTPVDVASALAYATQQANGTHVLNFDGVGPHVYNPSTYSYLLTKTAGWNPNQGDTMSQFVNYVLTLGQQKAPTFGYASLGLSLEQYGVKTVQANVPGAVPPTAAEQQAYACGDLTPSEVAAGQTTPTCGVVNPTAGIPGANGGTATGAGAAAKGGAGSGAGGRGGAGGGSGSGSGGAGADPSVALTGTTSMAGTGINPVPVILLGLSLFVIGLVGRRRIVKRRTGDAP